ncbi:hypothetical protein BC827DRAFT_1158514 [Russula dissimulans]|nr:hypothetical protein BC827DRAFT_1158514 [Russula dissimulans]
MGSLWSLPVATLSRAPSNAPWILSGSSEHEKVLVAFYKHQSQQLKDNLARAKEEYAFLRNTYERQLKHTEVVQAMFFDHLKRPLPCDFNEDSELESSIPSMPLRVTTTHADTTKHEDRTPVDGMMASNIRDLARALWRDIYQSGHAPDTWGSMTNEVRNNFYQEVEMTWPVLHFCDNHWKTNQIATTLYSQWYGTYHKKLQQPKKCAKTSGAMEPTDDTLDESIPPEELDNTVSPPIHGNLISNEEAMSTRSPRLRPLRDPLADTFNSPSSNFPILDVASMANITSTMQHDSTNSTASVAITSPTVLFSPNITSTSASISPFVSPMVIALSIAGIQSQ